MPSSLIPGQESLEPSAAEVEVVRSMRALFEEMMVVEHKARENGLNDLGDVLKRARREFLHPNFTSFDNHVEPEGD